MSKTTNARLFVFFFFLVFTAPAFAYFELVLEKYNAGKFEEAKKGFEALAAVGDRSSLFNLGVMHFRGEAVEKNPLKGYVLMKIANEDLNDPSFYRAIESIEAKLNAEEAKLALEMHEKLDAVYSISRIKENIFPTPLNDEDCPPEHVRIKEVQLKYPRSELARGTMGLTHMEFTISPEGYPRDLIASQSTNPRFTKSAVDALEQFLYEPTIDGKPFYGYRTIFTFQIEDFKVDTSRLKRELVKVQEDASSGDAVAQFKYGITLNTFRYFSDYLDKVDLQYRAANEWFMKSAEGGLPQAQFELGRNMIQGRGCEMDTAGGLKWIKAAAMGGYSPAQRTLAQDALLESIVHKDKKLAAIGWLMNASSADDFSARLLLAWELSTSELDEIRDGNEALKLLKSKSKNYYDDIRVYETRAAAYAELGKFSKAVKYQEKALKLASKRNWVIPKLNRRLELYKEQKSFQGSYY